jgi:hypothetical protein
MSAAVVLAALVLSAALVSAGDARVNALDDAQIKCKVCDRAVAHIWEQGVVLRRHCQKEFGNAGHDVRCDLNNLHKHGVEAMVKDVCDDLPKTHQSIAESEFEMMMHDEPVHDAGVAEAIQAACVRWVHDEHGVETLTRLIFANLDSGKSSSTILHSLQARFCDSACDTLPPPPKPDVADSEGDF